MVIAWDKDEVTLDAGSKQEWKAIVSQRLDLLAEGYGGAVVELHACEDQWQAVERPVRLEHVEQVANARLLDVAEEDGVVDVPEGIDVAEAHLQGRAVAVVIGHGRAILAGQDRPHLIGGGRVGGLVDHAA